MRIVLLSLAALSSLRGHTAESGAHTRLVTQQKEDFTPALPRSGRPQTLHDHLTKQMTCPIAIPHTAKHAVSAAPSCTLIRLGRQGPGRKVSSFAAETDKDAGAGSFRAQGTGSAKKTLPFLRRLGFTPGLGPAGLAKPRKIRQSCELQSGSAHGFALCCTLWETTPCWKLPRSRQPNCPAKSLAPLGPDNWLRKS